MNKPKKWRTRNGETLEIKWMNSTHLVNSLNLLVRINENQKAIKDLRDECRRRGLAKSPVSYVETLPQYEVPKQRESDIGIIWLNSMLDIVSHQNTWFKLWTKKFPICDEAEELIKEAAKHGNEQAIQILQRVAFYKLTR